MEHNNPLVSIIIPVFRIEAYIGECLDSVLQQTYKNIEIIVVDDGSDDGSSDICDVYAEKDKRIKVIHKSNGGLSSARNAGLDSATGKYIYFVDGDDLISQKCIERLISLVEQRGYDIVQCKTFAFLDRSALPPKNEGNGLIESFSGKEFCRLYVYGKLGTDGGVVWNKLYRKSIFDKIRFPEGLVYEDDATVIKLYRAAEKVGKINEKLSYYRSRRPGSIMHVNDKKYNDMLAVRRMQYDYFMNAGEKDLADQIIYLMANNYAVMRADKAYSCNKKGQLKQEHHRVMIEIRNTNVPLFKKLLNYIGYYNPPLWRKIRSIKMMLQKVQSNRNNERKAFEK